MSPTNQKARSGSTPPGARDPASPSGHARPSHLRSTELFGTGSEVIIEHNDREYRLRKTAQGKLILTA